MRKLLGFTIGFVAACLGVVYLHVSGLWPGLGALGLWGLLGLLLRGRRDRRLRSRYLRLGLLGLGVGLLWCWGYGALRLSPARALAGTWEDLTAEVCAYPTATDYGQRTEVWIPGPGGKVKAQVYFYDGSLAPAPGDRIRGRFTLRPSDQTRSGEERLDLQARGILLTGSVTVGSLETGDRPLKYLPQRVSHSLGEAIEALFPADAAGFYRAILTGDRSGLDQARRQALTAAGASHVIAVSGLHVSLLLGILVLLLGRGRLSSLLGILALAFFALMTGATPSVLRASMMLILFLLAPLAGEEPDPPTALAAAALTLLGLNPWTVANVSFQLSFGAVTGLLLVTPALDNWLLQRRLPARVLRWKGPARLGPLAGGLLLGGLRGLTRFVCGSLAATWGALVFTLPVSAWTFGSTAVYGVLANLLVLPLTGLCLGGGLGTLALGLVLPTPGRWLGWLMAWPARGIFGVCGLISRLPGALLYTDRFYGVAFLVFYCLAVALCFLSREKRYGPLLGSLILVLGASLGLQARENGQRSVTLGVLDVGQGQCVCVLERDFSMMVDCGGSSGDYAGVLAAQYLDRHGVDRLDALVLTHFDLDHWSGVPTLLELVPVERLYLPEVDFDPEARQAVEDAARRAGTELVRVSRDLTLNPGIGTVSIFAPVSRKNDNAACVSVLYSDEDYDMLITGDLEETGEAALAANHRLPPVELYVAGHHGSAGSSSALLLETISPEIVFISVGRNSYGLPSPETLKRLEAVGAAIYRTDQCGTLEIGR